MPDLTITLPYPPSINRYWRAVAGRNILSRDGRSYRERAQIAMLTQRARKLTGRAVVEIVMHAADRRRRDLDNICKPILDALVHGGALDDDEQIDDLRIVRGERDKDNPRVVVTLRPLTA